MWWGELNDPFVLPPKHAAVFRVAAGDLSDSVGWETYENDWYGLGVTVFDKLSQGEKQAAILDVARALLDANAAPPEVTAVLAGTVDAVYRQLQASIEIEIDTGDETGDATKIRGMLLDAMEESDYWTQANEGLDPDDEPAVPPEVDCRDFGVWADLVDDLRTEVLEDYDFDMEAEFLDMPPEEAATLKQTLGIRPDYFVEVPEDPKGERRKEIRQELWTILQRGS
jgi:hypothetical protein